MPDIKEQEFNELIKENHASIYRICRAYLYDVSHANDLYQEILFQVWKSLQNFKGQARVSTWIYRIAVNTAFSYNLKNKKHDHVSLPDSVQLPYEETLSDKKEHIVFLLWGKFAQQKAEYIDASRHLILKAAHPSPYSAANGFFGSKPFSKTNEYLTRQDRPPVEWCL